MDLVLGIVSHIGKEMCFQMCLNIQNAFHLKPSAFGSSRICPLTASQIHQTYFADLRQNIQ